MRRQLPTTRALRLLRKLESWPELANGDRFTHLCGAVADRPALFLDPSAAGALFAAWTKDRQRVCLLHASLGLSSRPQQPAVIKRAMLVLEQDRDDGWRSSRERIEGELAEQLAREQLDRELPTVRSWFFGARSKLRAPYLVRGLAAVGRSALPQLKSLLLDRRFEQQLRSVEGVPDQLAQALVRLAVDWKSGLAFPEERLIRVRQPRRGKGGLYLSDGAADEVAARAARRACVERVLTWLGSL